MRASAVDPFFYLALECGNSNAVLLEHSQACTDIAYSDRSVGFACEEKVI